MEDVRRTTPRQALTWALIILAAVVVLIGQRSGTAAKGHDTCVQVNQVKQAIVRFIDTSSDRSIKALPSNAYYRAHPVELGQAIAHINQQKQDAEETFAQSSC